MIVEPMAGDRVEDNLNPVGRAYYGFSTFLCTPASLSQEVGLALGAQAGEARIGDVVAGGGFTPLPPRRRDAVQPGVRGTSVSTTIDHVGRSDTGTPARAARRAGLRRARRRPRPLGVATGPASRRSCSCPRGRSCIRAVEGRRSRTWRATSASITFDGRGNGLSDRPTEPAAYAEREFVADARRGARRRGRRRGRSSSGISLGGLRALHPRGASIRSASLGVFAIGPAVPTSTPAHRRRRFTLRRRARERTRAGRSTTATTGCERLPRVPRVLLRRDVHRAALDEADRGLRRLGAGHDARGADRHDRRWRPRASRSARRSRRCCRSIRCPVTVIHGTDDHDRPVRARRAEWPS